MVVLPGDQETSFADRDDAKVWMIRHELEWKGRKITPYIRSCLALKMESIIAEKARLNQLSGLKQYQEPQKEDSTVPATLPKRIIPIETRKELSKMADVGERTLDKVKHIEARATPEVKKELSFAEGYIITT
jgi:hypothetical protein